MADPAAAVASLPERMPHPFDPDAAYDAFTAWASEARGLTLYPAQDEALVELLTGSSVILSTPTGSGKSLVAIAAHATALAQGRRTYYTAPIKALVSEKFFDLGAIFGPENVGMVTGDVTVNPDAPIVCCTAEILANLALRRGPDADVGQVVMDEFHYYAEPDRGWAWQVPLLLLTGAQFLLMSATLGDVDGIAADLERRTGRPVARITGVDRPVPLAYEYVRTPVHETVQRLLDEQATPVYAVHFSQKDAVERAQALSSLKIASRERRDAIADAIGEFRFSTGFGKTLSRYVRAGIGVHHAGMLPKYRRLVEVLAQRGLLPVICGTDTLGVGINVPIRTVLLTGLAKFDGQRMRQLSAREFHQIAGRAGRAGFDVAGLAIAEAPEHEIENEAAIAKAGDDPKKRRKIVRRTAPPGFVSWGQASFERLQAAPPEPLESRMRITAAMLINVIARGGDVFGNARDLVFDNHEPAARQVELARRAIGIFRTLVTAGVVELVRHASAPPTIRLTVDLQPDFALNQPLSPFALAAIELLDPDADGYALDVVSVIESTLDDPRPVLGQQEYRARGEAVNAMKAEGVEYEARMDRLEEVTYPKPLQELLEQAFDTFARSQPWVRDFELKPKSVVRDLFEKAMTFTEYVSYYQLGRSEGLVLRYLSDADRAIRQTVPEEAKTEELRDLIAWLHEVVRQVDSSLIDEWATLTAPPASADEPVAPAPPPSVVTNTRAFTVLVRNELFRRVQLAALERDDELVALDPDAGWPEALDAYFGEHDRMGVDASARSPALVRITQATDVWRVRQVIDDPERDHDWGIDAEVDLAASAEEGVAVVRVLGLTRLG